MTSGRFNKPPSPFRSGDGARMGRLQKTVVGRNRTLLMALLVLAMAAFVRFYHIGWSFSDNGVDEGIMLMRARMVGEGYALYSELPCDQAPLVFLIGSAFHGDVVQLRALTAAFGLVAIGACMASARRTGGDLAMLLTGLLLAVDFSLVRESRLFSLDAFSSFFLALSLPFLLGYASNGSKYTLALGGAFLGLSAASKLFGAVALLGVILFLLIEPLRYRAQRRPWRAAVTDCAILAAAAATPIVVLLLALGPSEMLRGMVFDQGHRELDLTMKLSVGLFFAFSPAYALPIIRARSVWRRSRGERLLLVLSAVLLANFLLQPLVFLHHMVLMSPGLAILSGCAIAQDVESRKGHEVMNTAGKERGKVIRLRSPAKALLALTLVVCVALAAYGLAAQGRPSQASYADRIQAWTSPSDWVVSGDPLITAYAHRLTPPELVNTGTRVYPGLSEPQVEAAVLEYNVSVFVVCYRFLESDMSGLPAFLAGHGYSMISPAAMGEWSPPVLGTRENAREPIVFVRNDIVERFDLQTA